MAASKKNSTIRRRLVSAWISTVISLALVLLLVGVGALLLLGHTQPPLVPPRRTLP